MIWKGFYYWRKLVGGESRGLFGLEGDKFTKLFNYVANSNRRKNSIESLLVNGSISSYQIEIREQIMHFYDILFFEQFSWPPKLDDLAFDSIKEEASWLEPPFEESGASGGERYEQR